MEIVTVDTVEEKRTVYYGSGGAFRVIGGEDAGLYFRHTDHLGSTSVISDANGDKVAGSTTVYAPFGEIRYGEQSDLTDFGFTGQRRDSSTGLMYYGARYYLPELRRFVSPDTIVPGAGNSQALNRYSYVFNNPLRYTDPGGHRIFEPGNPPGTPQETGWEIKKPESKPQPQNNPVPEYIQYIYYNDSSDSSDSPDDDVRSRNDEKKGDDEPEFYFTTPFNNSQRQEICVTATGATVVQQFGLTQNEVERLQLIIPEDFAFGPTLSSIARVYNEFMDVNPAYNNPCPGETCIAEWNRPPTLMEFAAMFGIILKEDKSMILAGPPGVPTQDDLLEDALVGGGTGLNVLSYFDMGMQPGFPQLAALVSGGYGIAAFVEERQLPEYETEFIVDMPIGWYWGCDD
jgi:RHS repeat-associated protein